MFAYSNNDFTNTAQAGGPSIVTGHVGGDDGIDIFMSQQHLACT